MKSRNIFFLELCVVSMLDFYLYLCTGIGILKKGVLICQHLGLEVTKLKNKSVSYFLCLFPFYSRTIFENTLFGKYILCDSILLTFLL